MRLFGIIGYPLSHSFSERYFTEKFLREGIDDAMFKPFAIGAIEGLNRVLDQHPNLQGLCVTIPYKKAVLPFLHDSSNEVKKIGACNSIHIKNGKLHGFNTDIIGFEKSFIKHLQPNHTKALVLGTGGAAAAVEFVLRKLGIAYLSVSRIKSKGATTIRYNDLTHRIMQEYTVIINTTPLGTYPNIDESAAIPYHHVTAAHYLFDLVYNPTETRFLRLGKEQGATIENGYAMLVLQAEATWGIWNG